MDEHQTSLLCDRTMSHVAAAPFAAVLTGYDSRSETLTG